MINKKLSQHIANRINAIPKQCWKNAFTAMHHSELMERGYYVEGWTVNSSGQFIELIEHGWCELDNAIVDPTSYQQNFTYFPALRLTFLELQALVAQDMELPVAYKRKFYEQYCKSYETATQFANDMKKQKNE